MSKKEREEAAMIKVGGDRKKGGKKPKIVKETEEQDIFNNIDISLLNLFGFLKISPPQKKEDLAGKIEEISSKKVFYETEG
jgi:hypothetical protein